MTETEKKALALVNECAGHDFVHPRDMKDKCWLLESICRAIEQHEAFRQEVSDAVEWVVNSTYMPAPSEHKLRRFIIAKPDPLVEAVGECDDGTWETKAEYAQRLRAAIEKRGGKIVWGEG